MNKASAVLLSTMALRLMVGSLPADQVSFESDLLSDEGRSIRWVGYQHDLGSFPDTGSFFDGNCWLNYLVPGATDDAVFGNAPDLQNGNINHNPHHIHFGDFNFRDFPQSERPISGGNASIHWLWINDDRWVFDFGSGSAGGAGQPAPSVGSLTAEYARIGTSSTGGSLTIRKGVLHLTEPSQWSMVISGNDTVPAPEVVVEGPGAEVSAVGHINVGNWVDSHGRLVVIDGGVIHSDGVYGWSNAEILVSGQGSSIRSLRGITDGTIVVERGATALCEVDHRFGLGWWDSPLAKATIRDRGSLLAVPGLGGIAVGGYSGSDELAIGQGYLEVLAEASVTGIRLYVARARGAHGEVLVSTSASVLMEESIVVGELGEGTMRVTSEGVVSSRWIFVGDRQGSEGHFFVDSGGSISNSLLYIGEDGSQGTARIEGPNSVWDVATGLGMARDGGTGSLTVRSRALVRIAEWFRIGPSGVVDVGGDGNWGGGRMVMGGADEENLNGGVARFGAGGSVRFHVHKEGGLQSGLIRANGIELAGVLQVVASGNALAAGDVFNVFDADTITGSFASLELPSLGGQLAWDTSKLARDGTLAVVSVVVPPNNGGQKPIGTGGPGFDSRRSRP